MKQAFQAMSKKARVALILILGVGALLAFAILRTDKSAPAEEHGHGHEEAAGHDDKEHHGEGDKKEDHAHADEHADGEHHDEGGKAADAHGEEAEPQKGPHGGRLFVQDGYSLELTIFETDTEPVFRAYTYRDGKPLAPVLSQVTVTLERLGRKPETFVLTVEKDYLTSPQIVVEPHSFKAGIVARSGNKDYRFGFEQIESRVTLTDEQLQRNGVALAAAGPAQIRSAVQLMGEVKLNQDKRVHLSPQVAGVVRSVHANAGDKVKRGQLLAVIASQELAALQAEFYAADKRRGVLKAAFEREQKLWQDKITAEQDYLAAQQAFQEADIAAASARQKLAALGAGAASASSLANLEIRAPISGVVTDKQITVGEPVRADSPIFQVADLDSVWVEMSVPAKEIGLIKQGDAVTVKSTTVAAEAEGKLSYVGALLGEQSRTAVARLVLPNPKGQWRPGLPVSVDIVAAEANVPVAVRVDALQTQGDSEVVYGRYGKQFESRPLTLGRRDSKFAEVLSGLRAGERYAVSNSFLIKAEIGKASASHDH